MILPTTVRSSCNTLVTPSAAEQTGKRDLGRETGTQLVPTVWETSCVLVSPPLLLALGIEAVTPRQMFSEALRDIPTTIGAAMIKHYRRSGYSPKFYEAFLKTSGVEFLIPLFRSLSANY
jgi:hypothetical protein